MNSKFKIQNSKWRTDAPRVCLVVNFSFLILNCASAALTTNKPPAMVPATNVPPTRPERAPETPREFFNAGTRMLKAGKLREAEAFLQSAVSSQDERVQPRALYNLGEVRFAQGLEEGKKADGQQTAGRARRAAAQADIASRTAEAALASNDVEQLILAYRQGRGARKDLREATKAVRAAMEVFGNTLLKWQRAAGDFQSAAELNSNDKNAANNADTMKRLIAKLIDQIRDLQQAMAAAAAAKQQLGEKLNQLKGKIPAPDAPPGGGGEEEEDDEDEPGGMRPEMQEGAGKPGEELKMSPEEAGQMLNGLRRDGDKPMPMAPGEEGKPKDPKRPNW